MKILNDYIIKFIPACIDSSYEHENLFMQKVEGYGLKQDVFGDEQLF